MAYPSQGQVLAQFQSHDTYSPNASNLLPTAIGTVGSLAGDVLAYQGQKETNAANAQQARDQMNFQREMSNTSYQRAVADMRAAGVNPALAYSQGGASSPGGASATMGNAAAAFKGSAAAAVDAFNAAQSAIAQRRQMDAATSNTQAQTNQIKIESEERLRDLQLRNRMSATTARQLDTSLGLDRRLKAETAGKTAQERMFLEQSYPARLKQAGADVDATLADIRYKNAQSLLADLEAPDARNRALSADTWLGRNLRPWMSDAHSASNVLGSLSKGFLLPLLK